MLSRWTTSNEPLRDLRGLVRRLDQLFGESSSPSLRLSDGMAHSEFPAVNIRDCGKNVLVEAEVPGMKAEELQIEVTRTTLNLTGERQCPAPEGYSVHRRERAGIRFARTLQLPCEVDVERVRATVENGILAVDLAKHPDCQPRSISVEAA